MPGDSPWIIEYLEVVAKDDIPKLTQSARQMVKLAIEQRLMLDPVGFGKLLRYSLKGHRRLRISDYRIIYCVEPQCNKVIIVAIKHRKDVYD